MPESIREHFILLYKIMRMHAHSVPRVWKSNLCLRSTSILVILYHISHNAYHIHNSITINARLEFISLRTMPLPCNSPPFFNYSLWVRIELRAEACTIPYIYSGKFRGWDFRGMAREALRRTFRGCPFQCQETTPTTSFACEILVHAWMDFVCLYTQHCIMDKTHADIMVTACMRTKCTVNNIILSHNLSPKMHVLNVGNSLSAMWKLLDLYRDISWKMYMWITL